MSSILLWLITLVLFGTGLLGIFIPAVPGIALIFVGVLFYAWVTNFAVVSGATVVAAGIVALLAWLAEYLGSVVGVKLGGGGRLAFWGTIIGALAGLIIGNAPGLLLGALLGAFLGALYEGRQASDASKIALLALAGMIGAKLVQLLLGIAIIIAFFIAVAI